MAYGLLLHDRQRNSPAGRPTMIRIVGFKGIAYFNAVSEFRETIAI